MRSVNRLENELYKRQAITWLLNNYEGIYITYECAINLIERGAHEHHMFRFFMSEKDEVKKNTIFMFIPLVDVVLATRASATPDTDDDTALAVSLIPTHEAREVFMNALK